MKKLFTLLTLALVSIGSAWGADAVSATQTFTNERATCTWTNMNVSVAKGNTAGGDGLYFEAGSGGTISTNSSGVVNIKNGRTMYVEVPSASSKGTITIIGSANYDDRTVSLNSGETITMLTDGDNAKFVATDVENVNGGYYIKVASTSDFKFKRIIVDLDGGEKYPELVAADPEFSLSRSSITTAQTAQIKVGSKLDLDGITFDGEVTYGTPGIVKVNEEGLITPVAVGTTTINFNTVAVAGKYNASSSNSLTITVTEAVLVFDAAGYNKEVILRQANIEAFDYLECDVTNFTDKGWSAPYNGNFLDMKSGRTIKITVKNVSAFEVYASGKEGEERTYTVKVGDAEAKTYYQHSSASILPSGVIATGTTDEVEIVLEGGSSSVYPAYIVFNPAVDAEITSAGYATFSSDKAVNFSGASGVTVYAAKVNDAKTAVDLIEVKSKQVPANTAVVLKGAAGTYTASAITSVDDPDEFEENKLEIAKTKMDGAAGNIYVLNEKDGVVGFYKLSAEGSLLAGKGYLVVDGVGEGRAMLEIDIDGISTGINMVNGEGLKVNSSETYYDLQGRRVLNPTKGLYIVNGKKVIVK